jgi:hypothetical protein
VEEGKGLEEHPRGALALVLLYGVFLVGLWLLIYFGIFLGRIG